jgi:hypothetical protein
MAINDRVEAFINHPHCASANLRLDSVLANFFNVVSHVFFMMYENPLQACPVLPGFQLNRIITGGYGLKARAETKFV